MNNSKDEIKKKIDELYAKNKNSNKLGNKINQYNLNISKDLLKQISENEKEDKVDDISDIDSHKQIVNKKIIEELNFKSRAKVWAIRIMLGLSIIIILNLLLVLYWNPLNFDYKIILGLITATFANLFALITVVFKYVFSPTKEMLDYNSALITNKEDINN
ncbi:hypothetical protein JRU67_11715 [Mammaliicoccus sciuri]|uniref:Uncharacterized protein n=1 Tax=Mammaliicoccus sciuri TaxID=1296 RepID=A0AB37HIS4_MAMSC|nr:hypothetical protein [Mammaliicoccus sciuri]QRN90219.1 hypothetical protein JRU67_09100 [Mammaliicoccus sciuri]QRN90710.1 hypothetical protein JRU67_11715 [Mammaliicoccus sciuri]